MEDNDEHKGAERSKKSFSLSAAITRRPLLFSLLTLVALGTAVALAWSTSGNTHGQGALAAAAAATAVLVAVISVSIAESTKTDGVGEAQRLQAVSKSSDALRTAFSVSSPPGDITVQAGDATSKPTPDRANAVNVPPAAAASSIKDPAAFVVFWQDTYTRLEQYHSGANRHLKSSYRWAQLSAGAGFLLVGTLGVIAARAHTATQAITAGAVGTVGGGLSGFISKTFNTTYKETLAQNNAYFHEPVVMARLLAAERLLAEYGDDKAEKGKALTAMITAAVAFDIGSVPTPPTIADGS